MNYEAILKNLQEYYSNLLIVQYHGKTKAKATVEKLVNLIYANMILLQIEYAYDWKTATGKQLDVIGQWVGVNRSYNLPSLEGRTLFAYPQTSRLYPRDNTSDRQHGYSTYDTYSSVTDGGMLRYDDLYAIDRQLTDDEFRIVIGLKIIFNNINHTAGEIDEAIYNYFARNLYYLEPLVLDTKVYYDEDLSQEAGQIYSLDVLTLGKAEQTDWTTSSLGFDASENKLVFVNGKYFILDSSGVYYSDDLENWTRSYIGSTVSWVKEILYVNNLYYAYDDKGNYYTSPDLNSWSQPTKMIEGVNHFNGFVYGNGIYIADVSTSNSHSWTISSDGVEWSEPISRAGNNLFFAKDRFFTTGGYTVKYSIDGIEWNYANTVTTDTGEVYRLSLEFGIAFGNGLYVGLGYALNDYTGDYFLCFATSRDGINWEFTRNNIFSPSIISGPTINSLLFANNQFYAIASGNDYYHTCIYTSKDGKDWQLSYDTEEYVGIYNLIYNDRKILGITHKEHEFTSYILSSEVIYDNDTFQTYPVAKYPITQNAENKQHITICDVYTTWQPHTLTYNYTKSFEKIIDYCEYKGILPAPTGVNIQTSLY